MMSGHDAPSTHHEFAGGDGLPETFAEVIENDDLFVIFAQLPDDVAADVAGTSRNEDLHYG